MPVGLALALVVPAFPLVTGAMPFGVGAARVPVAISCDTRLGPVRCVASGGHRSGVSSNDGGGRRAGRPAPPPKHGVPR